MPVPPTKRTELSSDVNTLNNEIERLQNVARPELVSLLQAGIAMDLLFRTDESVLADTTGDRLAQLAATLARMPDIHIQLDGFADERGDAEYNHLPVRKTRASLSAISSSPPALIPDRINVSAHGESIAQDETLDSYASGTSRQRNAVYR